VFKKIMQEIQHMQRATSHKCKKSKEKVNGGNIDFSQLENVKH